VIKAEHDLPGTEGGSGERVGEGRGGRIKNAHVNKKKNKLVIEKKEIPH
jgi:hypothetical protein